MHFTASLSLFVLFCFTCIGHACFALFVWILLDRIQYNCFEEQNLPGVACIADSFFQQTGFGQLVFLQAFWSFFEPRTRARYAVFKSSGSVEDSTKNLGIFCKKYFTIMSH